MWITDMRGEVSVTLEFQPDDYPVWQEFGSVELCATTTTCNDDACTVSSRLPQPRNPISFADPERICRVGEKKPSTTAFVFALKMTMVGACGINRLRVASTLLADDLGGCPTDETCTAIEDCVDNPYTYTTTT